MRLVRRMQKRKPRRCIYFFGKGYEVDWFPSRRYKPGEEPFIPYGAELYGPTPPKRVRRLRPKKGRRLIYPPLGWDQLTFPFPFVPRK